MRGVRITAFLAISALAVVPPGVSQAAARRLAAVVVVDGLTVEHVLRAPDLRSLAVAGGLGLLTRVDDDALRPGDVVGGGRADPGQLRIVKAGDLGSASRALRRILAEAGGREVLVLVASSEGTGPAGEPITPVLMARGDPEELLAARGRVQGLTSATTRRPGVVSDADLGPTVLHFLGEPVPEAMAGSPIRIGGEAPTDLYRRFAEYRRIVVPVGLVSLGIALAALVAGLILLIGPWRPGPRVARAVAAAGMFGVALQVALLPGSWLPSFRPAVVWPAILALGAAVSAAGLTLARRRTGAPIVGLAAIGLALVVADSVLGWPSLLTPLLGGSALDGVRFFGLGNAYAGMVLAGAVLVATVVPAGGGAVLIAGTALFAGLPFAGGDLGGAITLFAVAGMWFGLRTSGRMGVREVTLAAGAAVVGLAVVAITHRLWPVTEHVARAATAGPLGALEIFGSRLALNLEITARTPAVWPALLLLPVGLLVAWRPIGPFAGPLRRDPAWRHAVAALAAGGILGWILNDTFGMASVAFIYLAAALVYPPLEDRWTSG